MEQLTAILYRSEALTPAGGRSDAQIVSAADVRNRSLGITAFLHREADIFYQWLEGPTDAVRQIFASILNDPRHRNIEKLADSIVVVRRFPDLFFSYSDERKCSLFDWSAQFGITLKLICPDQILSFLVNCAKLDQKVESKG